MLRKSKTLLYCSSCNQSIPPLVNGGTRTRANQAPPGNTDDDVPPSQQPPGQLCRTRPRKQLAHLTG